MTDTKQLQELILEDQELKEEFEALDPEEREIVIAMAADAMVNIGGVEGGKPKGKKQKN